MMCSSSRLQETLIVLAAIQIDGFADLYLGVSILCS